MPKTAQPYFSPYNGEGRDAMSRLSLFTPRGVPAKAHCFEKALTFYALAFRQAEELFALSQASVRCQTGIIRTRFRAADFRLNRVIRNAGNSIHIGKVRLCKSAEKNCSEAGSYYSCLAWEGACRQTFRHAETRGVCAVSTFETLRTGREYTKNRRGKGSAASDISGFR